MVGEGGGHKSAMPFHPWPVRNSHKKMTTECDTLCFIFLAPPLLRSFLIRYCVLYSSLYCKL